MAEIKLDSPEPDDEDPTPRRPEDETDRDSAKKYEFVVWHNGQPLYRFESDTPVVLFDDEAIVDPAELAKLRKPKPGS